MQYIFIGLAALIILFVAVIVIRALMFTPKPTPAVKIKEVDIDEQKAIADLQAMIRCKTVSRYEPERIDQAEFDKFRALLPQLYPNVYQTCPPERIGNTGLLFHWKGKSSAKPSVLMSHYDVVPVDEKSWEKPPFDGIIEDGVLWGRGTLDTKGTLCGVLEAAEHWMAQGFVPQNDVYFAFAGDEEINGTSAPAIVATLKERGIEPELVLDEGGAVVNGIFPGVEAPCALVGIAEKGPLNVELSMESGGGHASAPPAHTLVGSLSQAVVNIENKPFQSQLTKPVAEMFDTLGRHSTFAIKLLFANLWCFKPLIDAMCKKTGGELNAMMRTTCAPTMAQASNAPNVLPPKAKFVANMRLLGKDTPESAIAYLKKVVNNDKVSINIMEGMAPSAVSETQGEGWEKLKSAIGQTWSDAIVSPYLMIACSDSRHYCQISKYVYRFSAMALAKEERGMIHGHNERIPLDKIVKTVEFYVRLVEQL